MLTRAMALTVGLVALSLFSSPARSAPSYQTEIIATIPGGLSKLSIVVDPAGTPWVVYGQWYDYVGTIYVVAPTGGNWQLQRQFQGVQPTNIVATSTGDIIVAYPAGSGINFAMLEGGLGGTWREETHGGGFSPWRATLALDSGDNLYCINHWSYHYLGYLERIVQIRAVDEWSVSSVGGAGFIAHDGNLAYLIDGTDMHMAVAPESDLGGLRYTSRIGGATQSELVGNFNFSSLAIGVGNVPFFSIYDGALDKVRMLFRVSEGNWEYMDLPGYDTSGPGNFMLNDNNHDLHIVFANQSNGELVYGKLDATGWWFEVVDGETGTMATPMSIALDSDGAAHMVYCQVGTGEIRYVHPTGPTPVETKSLGSLKALFQDE